MDFTILSSLHKVVPFQLCQRSKKHTQKFQKIQTFFLLILLSLFSLYFLTSNSINFIWVFAFFALIIISITITLPHSSIPLSKPPQTHVFLNKTTQNSKNPVIWSIGSDQKSEKVEKSGFLVKIFDNGDIYEGEVHNGNYSGKGVLVYHHHMCGCTQQVPIDSGCRFHGFQNRKSHDMCGKYEGDWVNGKYEGYGIEMWLSGSNYRGQYRNGLRNGFGVYKFHNGDVYEGEWFNGFCHGCGVVASSDGSVYVGLFKLGVKHGLGHFHFRYAFRYVQLISLYLEYYPICFDLSFLLFMLDISAN
ncbi:hypothetical protein RND81_08G137400 [Saponaria officinalis]|uniref:Uncharacterized protein n=1 Tax=Saponaria officinalis TaxID=3572 RepID=A0AAW1J714_SAPOF